MNASYTWEKSGNWSVCIWENVECLENHRGYREPLQVLSNMLKAAFKKYTMERYIGQKVRNVGTESKKCSYFKCEVVETFKTRKSEEGNI